jgi:hypothetical protein
MRLKKLLSEAPLKTYSTVGDFSKGKQKGPEPDDPTVVNRSMVYKRDRKMVTNPNFQKIVAKKFENLYIDVNLIFANILPDKRRGYRPNIVEVGAVDYDWVRDNLGEEVFDKVVEVRDDEELTVIFTNNFGAAKVPLTPWIMAHRIGHALARKTDSNRFGYYSHKEIDRVISENFNLYLQEVYGYRAFESPSYNRLGRLRNYELARRNERVFKSLAHALGTFKSAREQNLREWFEFYNELIAQYIITGKVKLNDLPRSFKHGRGMLTVKDEEAYEELKDTGSFERTLEYYIGSLIGEAAQHILVM